MAAVATRNTAIDMLRALTMTLMIFVNDFWKVHGVPQWMLHAAHGVDFMGLSDFVYPCFLFVVGMSVPYAIENRYRKGLSAESTVGHILTRTLSLLIMGAFLANSESRLPVDFPWYRIGTYWLIAVAGFFMVWNAYPREQSRRQKWIFTLLKIVGGCGLLFLALTFRSPKGEVFQFRSGILGGIAWTYLVSAVIYFFTRDNLRMLSIVWVAMFAVIFLTAPLRVELGGTAILNFPRPNFLDGLLHTMHIGNSALLALGGVILSVATEKMGPRTEVCRVSYGLLASFVCLLLGMLTHRWWIAAKLGITIPCIFFIYATATCAYTLLRTLCRHNLTHWYAVIRPAGTATLSTYMLPYVFYGFADITGVVLPDWLTHGPMGLVNCFCFALIVIAIAGIMERLHIKLKV